MMHTVTVYVVDGLANGILYSLLAMGLVVIYRTTRLVNMALGELAMFQTFIFWVLLGKMSPLAAGAVAVATSFLVGGTLEVVLMRKVGEQRDFDAIIVTVGLMTVINSLALWLWGSVPKRFPSPFGNGALRFGEVVLTHQALGTFLVAGGVLAVMFLFFQFTEWGLALRATSQNSMAAGLMGVPVRRMYTLGWAISAFLGLVAGALSAPKLFLQPVMMQSMLVYGLCAAVVGGLESLPGAIVGGLIVGVLESVAGSLPPIGSQLKTVATVGVLVAVLIVRPRGLLGRQETRKV